jgi:hypothetical protein
MQKLRVNSIAMKAPLCERGHPRSINCGQRLFVIPGKVDESFNVILLKSERIS